MTNFSMFDYASWCRRVGISLNAGLDIVSTLEREAGELDEKMQPLSLGNLRSREKKRTQPEGIVTEKQDLWKAVADEVAQGSSLHDALRSQKNHFPRLMIAMVGVGEESGHLGEMLIDLANYYDMIIKMKNEFWRSVTWPLFQLFAAIILIGLLILVLGIIHDVTGRVVDPFGLGLFGLKGFLQYLGFLAIPTAVGYGIYRYFRANLRQGVRWLHYRLDAIPKLQQYFRASAMARFTMSMNLTLRTGMDVRRALKLSFDAASYAPMTDRLPAILQGIEEGKSLCTAFPATEMFNQHFFLFLRAGEESGNLPSAMQKISDDYFGQTKSELKFLSTFAYFLVYGIVAAILIVLILRGYGNYASYLNSVG